MGPTEADYGNNVSGATPFSPFSPFLLSLSSPPPRPRSSHARVRHFSLIALLLSAPLSCHPLDHHVYPLPQPSYAPLLFVLSRVFHGFASFRRSVPFRRREIHRSDDSMPSLPSHDSTTSFPNSRLSVSLYFSSTSRFFSLLTQVVNVLPRDFDLQAADTPLVTRRRYFPSS